MVPGFGYHDSVAVATLHIDDSGYLRNGDYYLVAPYSTSRTGAVSDPTPLLTSTLLSTVVGYHGVICSSAGDVLSCYAEGRTSMNAFYVTNANGYYRLNMATPSSSRLTSGYIAVTINLQAP